MKLVESSVCLDEFGVKTGLQYAIHTFLKEHRHFFNLQNHSLTAPLNVDLERPLCSRHAPCCRHNVDNAMGYSGGRRASSSCSFLPRKPLISINSVLALQCGI